MKRFCWAVEYLERKSWRLYEVRFNKVSAKDRAASLRFWRGMEPDSKDVRVVRYVPERVVSRPEAL